MLVDQAPERTAVLEQALREAGHEVLARIKPNADLYRHVHELQPDLIIIDMESPSTNTLEHMRSISRDLPRPVVLFTQDYGKETLQAAMRAGVSAYVVDGLSKERVESVLQVAIARFDEYRRLKDELEKAKTSLAERKIIERAKGILMKERSCSEEEAYQALRKMAMDQNRRVADITKDLITVIQLLTSTK